MKTVFLYKNNEFLFASIFILSFLSTSVFASVNGTFSGSTTTDLTCSSSSEGTTTSGGFPESTNITVTLSSGDTVGIIDSVSMTSGHFTFNTSSPGSYTSVANPDGSIDISGDINGTMVVTWEDPTDPDFVDGTYTDSEFSFAATFTTSGALVITVPFLAAFGTGSTSDPCFFVEIVFTTLPATLAGSASPPAPVSPGLDSSNGLQVNPEVTPGSFITTPLIIKTQIRAITSDLHLRISDFLRSKQLRRKYGKTGSYPGRLPPRPLPPDRRIPGGDDEEEDENQAGISITPTTTGFMMNTLSGMNAGDSPYLYGAWASYSYTDFENDFAPNAFDGDRNAGLVGFDVSPWEDVLFGVAVGYESNDIDTDFNLGNQETDGFTIAPYFGAILTDTWSVDASFGYSSLETDQFRTLPGTTTLVTSSPDHDRWFWMLNVNGLTTYGNWIIGGKIGILYAEDEQDSYLESDGSVIPELDSELGQWNIEVDIAYSYGEYEPFARVTYENDYSQTEIGVTGGPQPAFDDDDVVLAFGLRYFGENNLSGNLEFNTRLGREDYDEYGFTANIRYEW